MKFDFCIGNPPYQEDRQGDSNTATPVYNVFMDAAYSTSKKTMLITPARFLFNAGYTPKNWNDKMLNDEHLKVLQYMPDSSNAFSGVDIKGGVAITYRDEEKDYGAIEIFTQFRELNKICKKVISQNSFKSIVDIIVSSFAYHYTRKLYEENPQLNGRSSKGHDYDIQSNAFSVFPEIFFDKINKKDDYIRILGRENQLRTWKYILRKYVTNVFNLDYYKVFLPKAMGAGQFGEILPEAIIGSPGDGSTVTFISIGSFGTVKEANNLMNYTKTKFVRALLGILKVTQDNTPGKWKYVPLQDFTPNSDIDWSKSVSEIDQQLYKKYGLSQEEIDFIESHVKEMA
ncbi:Eco57I restriction-modification methylase domain-containing protein [uncultured Anaerovibrio sp.]|uniref:Eco57I restriction-modification methylase domain-containing protein n=1 Tax=uncultured Anaerovibrio sp. TaxID=361586 RepID=UPI002611EE99|nr:Eco57I restriction-modification methylase domain-containing protein [uncultured Anaerovibrio sp.]